MRITLKGARHALTLAPYAPSKAWPDVAGIYAFINCGVTPPAVVFLAETVSFRATMPGNPHWETATRLGATHIFATEQTGDRAEIVADLVATYRPVLVKPAPPRATETGINDVLDEMTEPPERAPEASGVHDILDAMFAKSNPADRFGHPQFERPGAVTSHFGAQDRNPEAEPRASRAEPPKRRGLLNHLFSSGHSRRS